MVVGVNRFETDDTEPVLPAPDYTALAREQTERVRRIRQRRDSERHRAALRELSEGATGDAPLVPRIVEAVRARATVGEISETLRDVWGTFRIA